VALPTAGQQQLTLKKGEIPKDRPKSWADEVLSTAEQEAQEQQEEQEEEAVFGFEADEDAIDQALRDAAGNAAGGSDVGDGSRSSSAAGREQVPPFNPRLHPMARYAERNFNDPAVVHPVNKRRSLTSFKKEKKLERSDLCV
jgi:hypothetical protein